MNLSNDLDEILSKMTPVLGGNYIYYFDPEKRTLPAEITPFAQVFEPDGVSSLIPLEQAKAHGLESVLDTVYTLITVKVDADLLVPGITSMIASQFTARSIPCNTISSTRYDHLLVPSDSAAEAMELLHSLTDQAKSWIQP